VQNLGLVFVELVVVCACESVIGAARVICLDYGLKDCFGKSCCMNASKKK